MSSTYPTIKRYNSKTKQYEEKQLIGPYDLDNTLSVVSFNQKDSAKVFRYPEKLDANNDWKLLYSFMAPKVKEGECVNIHMDNVVPRQGFHNIKWGDLNLIPIMPILKRLRDFAHANCGIKRHDPPRTDSVRLQWFRNGVEKKSEPLLYKDGTRPFLISLGGRRTMHIIGQPQRLKCSSRISLGLGHGICTVFNPKFLKGRYHIKFTDYQKPIPPEEQPKKGRKRKLSEDTPIVPPPKTTHASEPTITVIAIFYEHKPPLSKRRHRESKIDIEDYFLPISPQSIMMANAAYPEYRGLPRQKQDKLVFDKFMLDNIKADNRELAYALIDYHAAKHLLTMEDLGKKMIDHDTILNCLAYGSPQMMSILLGKCHFGLSPSNVIAFLLGMPFADPENAVSQLTLFIDTALANRQKSDDSTDNDCRSRSQTNIAHYVNEWRHKVYNMIEATNAIPRNKEGTNAIANIIDYITPLFTLLEPKFLPFS